MWLVAASLIIDLPGLHVVQITPIKSSWVTSHHFFYYRQENLRLIYNNKELRIYTTPMTWFKATVYCRQNGYRIVEIRDLKKHNFLHYFLSSFSKLHWNDWNVV